MEIHCYFFRGREFDIDVDQFTSNDPIDFSAGDTNLRRYVGNNATNATDPSGLDKLLEDKREDGTIELSIKGLGKYRYFVVGEIRPNVPDIVWIPHGKRGVPLEDVRAAAARGDFGKYAEEGGGGIGRWYDEQLGVQKGDSIETQILKRRGLAINEASLIQLWLQDDPELQHTWRWSMHATAVLATIAAEWDASGESLISIKGVGEFVFDKASGQILRKGTGEVVKDPRTARAILREIRGLNATKGVKGTLDGLPGKTGKTGPIKEVPDAKALGDLFDSLSKGGKTVNPGTYPGVVKELPDGTIIRMRPGSKSGGATLDITMPDGTIIKVHHK